MLLSVALTDPAFVTSDLLSLIEIPLVCSVTSEAIFQFVTALAQ